MFYWPEKNSIYRTNGLKSDMCRWTEKNSTYRTNGLKSLRWIGFMHVCHAGCRYSLCCAWGGGWGAPGLLSGPGPNSDASSSNPDVHAKVILLHTVAYIYSRAIFGMRRGMCELLSICDNKARSYISRIIYVPYLLQGRSSVYFPLHMGK